MVEDRHTGWHALLEKRGLHQPADILEKNGMDSETDVSGSSTMVSANWTSIGFLYQGKIT